MTPKHRLTAQTCQLVPTLPLFPVCLRLHDNRGVTSQTNHALQYHYIYIHIYNPTHRKTCYLGANHQCQDGGGALEGAEGISSFGSQVFTRDVLLLCARAQSSA